MSVRAPDGGGIWREVDRLLRRRPGWHFQAMSSPGAPPAWCFGPEAEPEVSVSVERGSIHAYVSKADFDVEFSDTDQLAAWLTELWPGSLEEPKGTMRDKFKRGNMFQWE